VKAEGKQINRFSSHQLFISGEQSVRAAFDPFISKRWVRLTHAQKKKKQQQQQQKKHLLSQHSKTTRSHSFCIA